MKHLLNVDCIFYSYSFLLSSLVTTEKNFLMMVTEIMNEKLNIKTLTAAGESPFSNSIVK